MHQQETTNSQIFCSNTYNLLLSNRHCWCHLLSSDWPIWYGS